MEDEAPAKRVLGRAKAPRIGGSTGFLVNADQKLLVRQLNLRTLSLSFAGVSSFAT